MASPVEKEKDHTMSPRIIVKLNPSSGSDPIVPSEDRERSVSRAPRSELAHSRNPSNYSATSADRQASPSSHRGVSVPLNNEPNGNSNGNGSATNGSANGDVGTMSKQASPAAQPSSQVQTPAPVQLSIPPQTLLSGQKTHRKVSCELCHRRKIKCDQGRPACGSCVRKGKTCNYFDDPDPTVSRPTAPGHPKIDTLTPSAGHTNAHTPITAPNSAHPSSQDKPAHADKSKRNQRERILGGFDSDSEDDKEKAGEKDVKDEQEVDELDSESESGEKRGSDELAGELLELASGPPRKKSRQSAPSQYPTIVPANQPQLQIPTPISAAPRSRPGSKNHARPGSWVQSLPSAPMSSHGVPITTSHSHGMHGTITPVQALLISLPGPDIQHILFNTFFADPFLSEGVSLLHPQFMEDLKGLSERRLREGDATTLGCAFAFLATALRILPDETSKLLLASVQAIQPRSLGRLLAPSPAPDLTPLDQRYVDLALLSLQLAENEPPSVMLVMLKLVLYRYMMIRRDRIVSAGQHLAGAIKVAQALGMGKEWEGIPQGERELRRRVMWSLYVADRQFSFDTAFPYTILDAHQGIHLPSPISETDLYKIPADAASLPPQSTEVGPTPCTALFIHTHLARRVTPILDSFATMSPAHTPHDLVLRFDQSLDGFQEALPPYMRLFPLTDTRFDGEHPYLLPHRLRLHSTLLAYRQGVHRAFTLTYLRTTAPAGVREAISTTCLGSLRTQRSLRMLDPKITPRFFSSQTVFESAAVLALILHVEKSLTGKASVEAMTWRGGVAEGIELLDNVAETDSLYARRAVRVLRELATKVDGPRKTLDDLSNGIDTSPSKERGIDKVNKWLDSLPAATNMDIILRDPVWENGWESIVHGM